jgi:hypothetical protein
MHVKEKDLALLIENSLKPEKHKKVERHLSVCGFCMSRLHQWESLYNTIELLDSDFQLDGLEEKVINKINNSGLNAESGKGVLRFPALLTAVSFVSIVLATVVFIPLNKIINGFAGNIANLTLNAGVNLIQKIKWPLRNIISLIFADKTGNIMSVISAAILIIGGACFLISDIFNKKLKRA